MDVQPWPLRWRLRFCSCGDVAVVAPVATTPPPLRHSARALSRGLTRHFIQDPTAVCLDGSPATYFLGAGSGSGANKWVVFFEGGAWCLSASDCSARATTVLGTSMYVQS